MKSIYNFALAKRIMLLICVLVSFYEKYFLTFLEKSFKSEFLIGQFLLFSFFKTNNYAKQYIIIHSFTNGAI